MRLSVLLADTRGPTRRREKVNYMVVGHRNTLVGSRTKGTHVVDIDTALHRDGVSHLHLLSRALLLLYLHISE